MRAPGRDGRTNPFDAETARSVAARAPLGFGVFLVCVTLSTFFEMLRFPERRPWMGAFATGFVVLVAVAWPLVRRRPAWSIPILVGFVNAVGVALNAYHVLVGGSLAMCVWTLTGLLCASALILPWGRRGQTLASLGAVLSYPLHLEAGTADPLTWATGATYLLVVVALSVFGAALFTRFLQSDRRLTAALSEREARLQSYFDLALVGTAILTPEGAVSEANDELHRMLGYARPELLGRSWPAFAHPEERAEAAALVERALSGGAPQRHTMRCVRRDGEVRHVIVSVRPLPGPRGTVDHVMLLVQDVTERERYLAETERARREAEEASRAKDAFLAAVSHELRAPLTPILAWSGVLREHRVGADQESAALASIQRNAQAQARLIDDLLDVSRIVSGEWRLAIRPVALGLVVRAALDVVRADAEAKGVALETALPAGTVCVPGDAGRLQQVVWNLLSNAIKFTPSGGHVRVSLEAAGSRARLTVRDTGEGIDPEFLPHVFERFRQADPSTSRRHGGLGLGLAIVRALVERHAGTVRAESAGVGRGAVFTVELPLLAETTETGAEEGRSAERSSRADARPSRQAVLDGLRVLVVDDDPESNTVVSALLGSYGAEVETALSSREALALAERWQPDVLVSDVAMPEEDGYALLRKLRARGGALGEVPAIALTAYAGPADRERLLAAGFRAHVAKPFDPAQLAAVVEDAAQAGVRPV